MEEQSIENMTLYERLLAIRIAVELIKKDDKNEHFNFTFASSSNVLKQLRALMDKYRVLLIPSVLKQDARVLGPNKLLTEMTFKYTWVSVDNPGDERIECQWYGQGVDSGERGVGKAATYSEKYFLLKFFNIPTDDDDPDGKSVTVGSNVPTASVELMNEIKNIAVEYDIDVDLIEEYLVGRKWMKKGEWHTLKDDAARKIVNMKDQFVSAMRDLAVKKKSS